jgi:mono/diheme cytochrome c family protein
MSPEITKIIEQYLQNELPAADRAVFEQRLTENDQLLNEVVLQQQLHEAAKRAAQRATVKQTAKRYHFRKNVATTAVVVIVATAIAAVTLLSIGNDANSNEQLPTEKELTLLVDKIEETPLPLDGLPAQYFNLSQQDTVLLSELGVLLSIPEGAFALGGKPYNGPKVVQWQEATRAADIVKGGLSTMAGDRLLETQGMFGLQAFTPDGRELDINPKVGVYVQVPVDEKREGMQLFEGRKGTNGIIDWENPQPLEKLPVMADMKDLDLYPEGYEPKLNELKWKTGKKDRDSLYLSFEDPEKVSTHVTSSKQDTRRWVEPATGNPIIVGENLQTEYRSFTPEPGGAYLMPITSASANRQSAIDGKKLFDAKCATCHRPHVDGTGPALFRVRAKWAAGGAKPGSIYQWVREWEKAAMNDPYAAEVTKIKPVDTQNFPELTDKEIDAIFDYIDGIPQSDNHIPPSKVLAIWKPEFNKTILATRDFEKRMKSIHQTCSEKVLSAYTNNLNKPIYEIDQQVAAMGYPQFAEFAKERIGGVKLSNPHINNLRQFYDRTTAELKRAARHNHNLIRQLEKAWDDPLNDLRGREQRRTQRRTDANAAAEYKINYEAASRQLGYGTGFTIRRRSPGRSYNLDKYTRFVSRSTTLRETASYEDTASSKKATIVYNPFAVTVENPEQYGKLMLYLFPEKLKSFERINPTDGRFKYFLNDFLSYDMAIVGISEDGYYICTKNNLSKGDLGTVQLRKVSEEEFNRIIESLNAGRDLKKVKVEAELDWLSKEQQNYKVQRLRQANAVFRKTVRSTVFPCENTGEGVEQIQNDDIPAPVQTDRESQDKVIWMEN